jgi:hypothetical protein
MHPTVERDWEKWKPRVVWKIDDCHLDKGAVVDEEIERAHQCSVMKGLFFSLISLKGVVVGVFHHRRRRKQMG